MALTNKHFQIHRNEAARLKKICKAKGMSEAEYIRRAVYPKIAEDYKWLERSEITSREVDPKEPPLGGEMP